LTCHAKNPPVPHITEVVPALSQDHHGRAFRQVALQPLLVALHQPPRGPCTRRGGGWAEGLASPLHPWPQRGQGHGLVARVAFAALPLRPGRHMRGRRPRAEATRRLDVSGPWAGEGPWPRHAVVDAEDGWPGACRAGRPAPTQPGGLRLARGLCDPALEAVVGRRVDPYGVQACRDRRRRCARPRAARRANTRLDRPVVLGGMGRGISHGPGAPRTDTTPGTPRPLAAVVAPAWPGYARREPSRGESCPHGSDRRSRRPAAGDDRAGLSVPAGHPRARHAVGRVGIERPASQRPQDVRRQRCTRVPVASRAGDRWPTGRRLGHETRHGRGGEAKAWLGEDVGQSRRAAAGVWCLGTPHGSTQTLRCGGSVDTGHAIHGGQAARLGLMAVCVNGVAGDAEETGDHHHTADRRSDPTQPLGFDVIPSGLNLQWS
jgi:hypothetical protein